MDRTNFKSIPQQRMTIQQLSHHGASTQDKFIKKKTGFTDSKETKYEQMEKTGPGSIRGGVHGLLKNMREDIRSYNKSFQPNQPRAKLEFTKLQLPKKTQYKKPKRQHQQGINSLTQIKKRTGSSQIIQESYDTNFTEMAPSKFKNALYRQNTQVIRELYKQNKDINFEYRKTKFWQIFLHKENTKVNGDFYNHNQ